MVALKKDLRESEQKSPEKATEVPPSDEATSNGLYGKKDLGATNREERRSNFELSHQAREERACQNRLRALCNYSAKEKCNSTNKKVDAIAAERHGFHISDNLESAVGKKISGSGRKKWRLRGRTVTMRDLLEAKTLQNQDLVTQVSPGDGIAPVGGEAKGGTNL